MKRRFKHPVRHELKRKLSPSQVRGSWIKRHAYARDASFYRLLPRMVIKAFSVKDIATVFKAANKRRRHVVLRAGGTSLSGQAISDDILVEVKQGWRDLEVLNEGQQIKLQPGVIGIKANQHLEPRGYRIGPDPASINTALIGGIVANNASGIGSGIALNSYHTLSAMEMILPNGLVLNSGNPHDNDKLHGQAPEIFQGLESLRDDVRANKALTQKIRSKYKLKNTVGYSLNSFLDYDTPLDILAHLMVGSEGTLGFISSVTLNTVPIQEHKATALLVFPTLAKAAALVPSLTKCGAAALEIMDDAALRAIQHVPGLPGKVKGNIEDDTAALLVEFHDNNQEALSDKVDEATAVIQSKHPEQMCHFFSDEIQRNKLWKTRRELGPLHASTHPMGTTVISEDICFQVRDLARAIKDLKLLFTRYRYHDAIIFGHAGDGNLHFKFNVDFARAGKLQAYADFMSDLVDLVIDKYKGSLKAEHGTGRNMAPFVAREWGAEAYGIMKEIKNLLDPRGILNPDVLMSGDNHIHLKHIKTIPPVDSIVDKCIECGLCEPWCPSADFSLSPRQRINVLREIEILRKDDKYSGRVKKLRKQFRQEGVDSCAVDGLCGLSCPVNIDTGLLMKTMRAENRGPTSDAFSRFLQRHFASTLSGLRIMLKLFSPLRIASKSKAIYQVLLRLTIMSRGVIPVFNSHLLASQKLIARDTEEDVDVIYFPSCVNRSLADPARKDVTPGDAFDEIMTSAGLSWKHPEQVNDLCCGLSFSSKGFTGASIQAAIQTVESLWVSTKNGRIPVVMDTSPCSHHLKNYDEILSGVHLAKWRELNIFDMVEYLHDMVLDKIKLSQLDKKVVLHPTCSTRKMGVEDKMLSIAKACAQDVIIPVDLGCCAFAGDKGLKIPQLTKSATNEEAKEIKRIHADGHFSTSRTCEMGMSQATGKDYQSIIYLVYDALQNKSQ